MQVPHDADTEQAVVAILLSGMADKSQIADTYARLKPEMFYGSRMRMVYAAARGLYESSQALPDTDAVLVKLADHGQLADCGGRLFVFELVENAATAANLEFWVERVEDYSRRRETIRAASVAVGEAADLNLAIDTTVERLSLSVSEVASGNESTRPISSPTVADRKRRAFDTSVEKQVGDSRLATGILSIDTGIGGLARSEMTILAGRPSMGKTSLALTFLLAMREIGAKSLFFSLEMSEQGITDKILSMRTGIEGDLLRRPWVMNEPQRAASRQAIEWLGSAGIEYVFAPEVTPLDVRARARAVKARSGLDLIVVDYLQFMKSSEKTANREREVATISRTLKSIAMELDVAVLCLSQLNRMLEQSSDKRPMLSHLRESGAIEQDADVVMFVHRPAVYDKDGDPTYAEAIVAKNRNGQTCICPMSWIAKRTLFTTRQFCGATRC